MKRVLLWLAARVWIWLAVASIGLIMSHEKALIDDGAEAVAADFQDAVTQAVNDAKFARSEP